MNELESMHLRHQPTCPVTGCREPARNDRKFLQWHLCDIHHPRTMDQAAHIHAILERERLAIVEAAKEGRSV